MAELDPRFGPQPRNVTITMETYVELCADRHRLLLLKEKFELAAEQLRQLASSNDQEVAHKRADDVLCQALEDLGQGELVEAFKTVPRWYA